MPTPGAGSAAVGSARGSTFRLIGVVHASSVNDAIRLAGTGAHGIPFRDVAAIVRPCANRNETPTDAAFLEHHALVAELSRSATLIPAPPLTTFRSGASALHWLELHANLGDVLARLEIRGRLEQLGATVRATKPDEFANYIAEEMKLWGKVVRDNKIGAPE